MGRGYAGDGLGQTYCMKHELEGVETCPAGLKSITLIRT